MATRCASTAPDETFVCTFGGIDAPEIKEPGGIEASRALSRLIKGQALACDLMDVDHYGRPVVRCGTEVTNDLACELVKQGHAVDWPRFSNGAYAGCSRR